MKIVKLQFSHHPILGDMEIDFTGPDGKALDTIVFAGINGSGKTTMLELIRKIMFGRYTDFRLTLSFPNIPGLKVFERGEKLPIPEEMNLTDISEIGRLDDKEKPAVIYMPTEINFSDLKTTDLSFKWRYQEEYILNRNLIEHVPSFIASMIFGEVFANPDLPAEQAIDKVCKEINSLFDILEIDARLVGVEPQNKLPLFKNSAGKTFDINLLSSGEKQVFIRALSLKMLKADNAIILIDEPEISLHPSWQQRIMKVYEQIGENNQVIAATHSPHIVASVKKESVKLLKRRIGKIELTEYNDINGSYGLPTDVVLRELMELDTTRDPDVEKKIRELWEMLHNRQFDREEFKDRFRQLEDLLGSDDEEILLMRIEIAKYKAQDGKTHAGNPKD